MIGSQNGDNGAANPAPWLQIVITVEQPGGKMDIAGSYPSNDHALNALGQATRHIEARWRFEQAEAIAKSRMLEQRNAQVAQDVLNRRR